MKSVKRKRSPRGVGRTLAAAIVATGAAATQAQAVQLNLMHFSDGESSLLTRTGNSTTPPPTTFQYSGVSLFGSLIDQQRNASGNDFDLLVTAGDNFLAGAQFEASRQLPAGEQFYDAKALAAFGVDVGGIGNHEFDFGPDTLTRFIDHDNNGSGFIPFVSSNLVIPNSNPLKDLIKPSVIVTKNVNGVDEKVGVVGVTTPLLKSISSPGDVTAIGDVSTQPGFQDLVNTVQAEVNNLQGQGINKIVLVSHLQDLNEEKALATVIQGVDVIVAAGSDTRLANPDDPILPLNGESRVPSYPLIYDSATGQQKTSLGDVTGDAVVVVSADGEYKYLGNLVVDFDANGKITSIAEPQTGPKRNSDLDGLTPRSDLVNDVQNPVAAFVQDLKTNVVGSTDVALDSITSNVRSKSTFMGSLIADALREAARDNALSVGIDPNGILVGVQNGGGIRNNRIFTPGTASENVSEFDTIDILPFSNFVTIVKGVTITELLSIAERSVASLNVNGLGQIVGSGGQFLHFSGLEIVYDVTQTPHNITAGGVITEPGSRIQSIFLDPDNDRLGYYLFDVAQGGFLVDPNDPLFDLATINFTARGGDNFAAFAGMDDSRRVNLPVSYQEALLQYIMGDLGGQITADKIASGEGIRVRDISAPVADATVIPEPGTMSLASLALSALGLLTGRRRRR